MEVKYDPVEKTWSGPQLQSIYNPKTSIGEIIFCSLKRNPKNVAQINADDQVTLTYEQILAKSILVAENLAQLGFIRGDIIALVSRNNSELSSIFFGCLMQGLVVNTLDPTFLTDDILHMFKATKPKLVFCEAHNEVYVKEAIAQLSLVSKIVIIGDNISNGDITLEQLYQPVDVDVEKPFYPTLISNPKTTTALIVCSSGTTGLPKGVCLSHSQVVSYLTHNPILSNQDVMLAFSSLYWVTGIMTLMQGTVAGAKRIVTTRPFSPDFLLDLIEQYKLTYIFSPPSYVADLMEHPRTKTTDFSSVTCYLTGGSLVLEELRKALDNLLPNGVCHIGYSMTEILSLGTSIFASTKPARHSPKSIAASVGKPHIGTRFKIMDEFGNHLGPNEEGEICIKVKYTFLGYMGNEEQTKVTLLDGWIHTGDVGYFDDGHFLFINGRSKEIIKYRNYQISPLDIEEFLSQRFGLLRTCAVGIPDHKHGNDLLAVTIQKGTDEIKVTDTDLIKTFAQELADHKRIRGGVYFLDQFPLTPSGKVKRNEVKQIVSQLYKEKLGTQ